MQAKNQNRTSWMPWAILIFLGIVALFGITSYFTARDFRDVLMSERSQHFKGRGELAIIKIEGPIMSSEKTLEKIAELIKDSSVKAVVVRINSPGGAVGPSQEIYDAIRSLRNKKTVYCSLGDMAASGGYYIAAACSQIFSNPGTLTGSIGVIMTFINLKDLFHWAKVEPNTLKAGKFKDIGSQSRKMNDDERKLMQDLLDEVHFQFKKAIFEGRNSFSEVASTHVENNETPEEIATDDNETNAQTNDLLDRQADEETENKKNKTVAKTQPRELAMSVIDEYGDGRIFTGETAHRLGFVDKLGGINEAINAAADAAGLGPNFKIRKEHGPKKGLEQFLDMESSLSQNLVSKVISSFLSQLLPNFKSKINIHPGIPYYLPEHLVSQGQF